MEHAYRTPLNARILVADDTPANVILMDSILRTVGFTEVWTTSDPRQVKPLHEELGFELIILDINMPHMSGFQVMEALADDILSGGLQVLVITAISDWDCRLRAMELGAGDFITLPYERSDVLARIRTLLRRGIAAGNTRECRVAIEEL